MRTQTVAVVNGTPDVMASLESLFEGGRYDVVFPGLSDAYADIRRLRPERVVLCTVLEQDDAILQLLTMLRLDRVTRDIPVVAVTPYGECDLGGRSMPVGAGLDL